MARNKWMGLGSTPLSAMNILGSMAGTPSAEPYAPRPLRGRDQLVSRDPQGREMRPRRNLNRKRSKHDVFGSGWM
jgi:hypothetical protein